MHTCGVSLSVLCGTVQYSCVQCVRARAAERGACGRERGERMLARRVRRARGESGARSRSACGEPRLIWKEGGASPPLVPPCTAAGVRRPNVLLPFSDLFDFQRRRR